MLQLRVFVANWHMTVLRPLEDVRFTDRTGRKLRAQKAIQTPSDRGSIRPMTKLMTTGAVLTALLLAAGCSRSMPSFDSANSGPSPLAPQPTAQVAANQLPPPPPPPPPGQNQSMTGAPGTDPNNPNGMNTPPGGDTQMASLDPNQSGAGASSTPPAGGGQPLSRNKVLGAYKVTTAGGNCQIILSLTKWSGGYRAASRGCPGAVADVSAWDVSGNNVVLRNAGGSQVASLSSTGDARYDGQTTGGQAISLYR